MPCGIFQPNGDESVAAVDDVVEAVDNEGGLLLTIELGAPPSNDEEVKSCCTDNNMTEFNTIINIVVDRPNDDDRPAPPESVALLFAMLNNKEITDTNHR